MDLLGPSISFAGGSSGYAGFLLLTAARLRLVSSGVLGLSWLRSGFIGATLRHLLSFHQGRAVVVAALPRLGRPVKIVYLKLQSRGRGNSRASGILRNAGNSCDNRGNVRNVMKVVG